MAKQITAYQADDGKIFESEEVCVEHDRISDFCDWCERNGATLLYGTVPTGLVDPLVLEAWLDRNRDYVLEFLRGEL